jgi:hypothetical protein
VRYRLLEPVRHYGNRVRPLDRSADTLEAVLVMTQVQHPATGESMVEKISQEQEHTPGLAINHAGVPPTPRAARGCSPSAVRTR